MAADQERISALSQPGLGMVPPGGVEGHGVGSIVNELLVHNTIHEQ